MPRYPYGRQYEPPAPVLRVRVGRPGTRPALLLAALVDTGADLCVLPDGLPERLDLPAVGHLTVAGVDGRPQSLTAYVAELAVEAYRMSIRVIGLGTTPLVGRNLLNKLVAHLDGPKGVLEVDLGGLVGEG